MSLQRTSTMKMQDEGIDSSIWGRLVPLSKGLASYDLKQDTTIIGRNPECSIQINDKRLSGKHCEIVKKDQDVSITDLSTNGTFLKTDKIGKNKTQKLTDNIEIWLLPTTKVNPSQTFGFKIELLFERKAKEEKQQEQLKKKIQQEKTQKQKEKKKKQEEGKKQNDFAQSIKDQITCSFCFEVMYIPVSVQPCNHRFCGACLTDLVEAKKQQCIQCRKDITTAARDSTFNSIIDDYLKRNPDEKRTQKEYQQATKKNIFGHDPIDYQQKIHGKKKVAAKTKAVVQPPARRGRQSRGSALRRAGSDLSASDDEDSSTKCRQCAVERNGFKCTSSQIHVGCHTCGKLMANRDDPALHQYCVICTTNFCNLYFPPCSRSGVKLQLLNKKRNSVKIDAQLLKGNKYEFEAIKNHLLAKKQNSKDVFDFMMKKVSKGEFSYLFDKKIMRVPPIVSKQVKLQQDSAICDLCFKDVWFQMVFAYRTAISADLPSAVRDRPICYWGVNCRTVDHNIDHARKYNHLVFQTRFS